MGLIVSLASRLLCLKLKLSWRNLGCSCISSPLLFSSQLSSLIHSHGQNSAYFSAMQDLHNNSYHPTQNPTGISSMGLAENQLSFPLLEEWLHHNPHALDLQTTNGVFLFKELALFQDYHGLPAFKKSLVEFLARIRQYKVKFEEENLVLTAGATAANEILMFCLVKPGQAFLFPTPYYPGFDRDLKWRTRAQIVPINTCSSDGFRITEHAIEEALKRAEKLNLTVKGVLITNPSNPLGTTMSRFELDLIVAVAETKGIHIVSDEVYSGTVYNCPGFISIMDSGYENSPARNRIHVVYSLSKDLGVPGFRAGMIYSNDPNIVKDATKMSSSSLISSQTQYTLSQMLCDRNFIEKYTEETKKRIKERKEKLVSGLQSVGIGCFRGNAGLFCWVDMRHLLNSATFEEETKLWERILREGRVNISPGASFHCSEPGWFRICFANMSEDDFKVALRRLKAFVTKLPPPVAYLKT